MAKTKRSLCLFKQLHSISMKDAQNDYMRKQQELIDAMTDEMTELYRTQEITENAGNYREKIRWDFGVNRDQSRKSK